MGRWDLIEATAADPNGSGAWKKPSVTPPPPPVTPPVVPPMIDGWRAEMEKKIARLELVSIKDVGRIEKLEEQMKHHRLGGSL